MTGPLTVLIIKISTTHYCLGEDSAKHIYAVTYTHLDMVKFSLQDYKYDKVHGRLKGLTGRAVTKYFRTRTNTDTSPFKEQVGKEN